jgi:hypothetical protein
MGCDLPTHSLSAPFTELQVKFEFYLTATSAAAAVILGIDSCAKRSTFFG